MATIKPNIIDEEIDLSFLPDQGEEEIDLSFLPDQGVQKPSPQPATDPLIDMGVNAAFDSMRSVAEPSSTKQVEKIEEFPAFQKETLLREPVKGEPGYWQTHPKEEFDKRFEYDKDAGFMDSEGNMLGAWRDKQTGQQMSAEEMAETVYPKELSDKPGDYHSIKDIFRIAKGRFEMGEGEMDSFMSIGSSKLKDTELKDTDSFGIKIKPIFDSIDPESLTPSEEMALYGVRNLLNSSILGMYRLISPEDFEQEAKTGLGAAGGALGSLLGTIPSAFAISGKLVGLIPQVVKASRVGKIAESVGRSTLTIGLGSAFEFQGGNDVKEILDNQMNALIHGMSAGAMFGGAGEVSKFFINDLTAGAVSTILMAIVSGVPSSMRGDTTEEQMYNYLLGAYFGGMHGIRRGRQFRAIDERQTNLRSKITDLETFKERAEKIEVFEGKDTILKNVDRQIEALQTELTGLKTINAKRDFLIRMAEVRKQIRQINVLKSESPEKIENIEAVNTELAKLEAELSKLEGVKAPQEEVKELEIEEPAIEPKIEAKEIEKPEPEAGREEARPGTEGTPLEEPIGVIAEEVVEPPLSKPTVPPEAPKAGGAENIKSIKDKYKDIILDINESPITNTISLSRIIVPKKKRLQGIGSLVMKDIIKYADETGKIITLTPTKDFGASSVERLSKFYKGFGFIDNKGKNKIYEISDTMYRNPEAPKAEGAGKQPWEMKRLEFLKWRRENNITTGWLRLDYIEKALKEGKSVPAEVLADYPDFAKKYAEAPKAVKVKTPKEESVRELIDADEAIPELAEEPTTGIKKQIVMSERELRNLSPAERIMSAKNAPVFNRAKELVDKGERNPRALAEEFANIGDKTDIRPMSGLEQMIIEYDRQRLRQDIKVKRGDIDNATDPVRKAELQYELKELESALETNDLAALNTGDVGGFAHQIRRLEIKEDYSLAEMTRNMKHELNVEELSPEIQKKINDIAKNLENNEALVAAYEEKISNYESQKAFNNLKNEVDFLKRKQKRAITKQEISTELDGLLQDFAKISQGQLNVGLDPRAVIILGKIARNRIQAGANTIEGLVDAVSNELRKIGVELSDRTIRDAITGYGKQRKPVTDEYTLRYNELTKQGRRISKLEDARDGIRQSSLPKTEKSKRIKELDEQISQAQRESGITQEISLERWKTRTRNEIIKLENKTKRRDTSKKDRIKTELDKEGENLLYEKQKHRDEYDNMVFEEKLKNRTGIEKTIDGIQEVIDFTRATKTSFDFSALLRQGIILSARNPMLAGKSIITMLKAFKSEKNIAISRQRIMNDPLYRQSRNDGLFISERTGKRFKREEVYRSRLARKVPIVAASERAYTAFLDEIRFNTYKQMVSNLELKGKPLTVKERQAIANAINVVSGRGNEKFLPKTMEALSNVLFSPRFAKSRFEYLLGQPLYKGSARTRIAIAKDMYAKPLLAISSILFLADLMGHDVETDPRSSDFLKIRFGEKRLDLLAGLAQTSTFMARIATGKRKNAKGELIPIRGEEVPYGQPDSGDIIYNFFTNKLAPVPSVIEQVAKGKDFKGDKFRYSTIPDKLFTPISFHDVYEAFQEEDISTGSALAFLAILGANIQHYESKQKRRRIQYK